MTHPQYDQYEPQFLDAVAAELGLVDESAKFFKARVARTFSERYATNTQLVEDTNFLKSVFPSRYREKDSKWASDQAITKLKETLRKTKPKINQNNWTLDGQEIRDWKDLIAFLRNIYFEKWWEKNQYLFINLWEQLWDKVDSFEGIKINTQEGITVSVLDMNWKAGGEGEGEEEEKIPTFSWDKALSYNIQSQQAGYLTLIQKFASGKLCFFLLLLSSANPINLHKDISFRVLGVLFYLSCQVLQEKSG